MDGDDMTYENLFRLTPESPVWPEATDTRIAALENASQEHTEEIANTDFNLKALLMRVESLEAQAKQRDALIHRLLNADATQEDDHQ